MLEIELTECLRSGEPAVRELVGVVGCLDVLDFASCNEVAH